MGSVEKGAGAFRRGALLILCGMAVIGLIDNWVVEIGKLGGLWQFHAMRAAMAVPLLIVTAHLLGVNLRPTNPVGVMARTGFLAAAMIIYFASIPAMPIALVVAGLFTSPVFVLLISALVFRERIGPIRISAVCIGFVGVILILNPAGASFELSFLAPVLAGALYAMHAVTTRRYCADEPTLTLLVWFFSALGFVGLIGTIWFSGDMSAAFHLRGWITPSPMFLFWTAVQAIGSMFGVFLLTRAYQIAAPSYMAVFEYSLLVFVSFWAWVLYQQTVGLQAAIGMALVALSGTIIARRTRTTV